MLLKNIDTIKTNILKQCHQEVWIFILLYDIDMKYQLKLYMIPQHLYTYEDPLDEDRDRPRRPSPLW